MFPMAFKLLLAQAAISYKRYHQELGPLFTEQMTNLPVHFLQKQQDLILELLYHLVNWQTTGFNYDVIIMLNCYLI